MSRSIGALFAPSAAFLAASVSVALAIGPPASETTVGAVGSPQEGAAPQEGEAQAATPAIGASSTTTRADVLPPVAELMGRYDCLACHAPESTLREALDPVGAPELRTVTQRVDHDWLLGFLNDPRSLRPDTVHPHQLIAIPENAREMLAEDIVHFLRSIAPEPKGEIPGFPETSNIATLETGRTLFHEVGCVVCHGAQESLLDLELPLAALGPDDASDDASDDGSGEDSGGAASEPETRRRAGILEPFDAQLRADLLLKYRPSTLAAFLQDPVAIRPSGHCPSMSLTATEASAIAAYLLRDAAQRPDGTYERRPGLVRTSYEGDFKGGVKRAFGQLDKLKPEAVAIARAINLEGRTRNDGFGLRFDGLLEIDFEGSVTFHLRSDDGSRLYLDGALVIDNGGSHPPRTITGTMEVEPGFYGLRIDFYEVGGGEELGLLWSRDGGEPEPIPAEKFSHWPLSYDRFGSASEHPAARKFEVEAVRAERGRRAFARLGCAVCHSGVIGDEAPFDATPPPSFEQLAGVRPGVLVCLRPDGRYNHSQEAAGELLSAFVKPDELRQGLEDPKVVVERTLARRNCYGCHRRDDIGGVHPDQMSFFTGDEEAELGDQGRFPPTLTAVGAKLQTHALQSALEGDVHVRPYLNTRMPKVGAKNVEALASALEAADRESVGVPPIPAPFECTTRNVDAGRRLAGDKGGLGCVQCHDFLGTASLGVRAVDLGTMRNRLRYEWFRQLLLDPSSVDLDSRMANVWVDGDSPVQDIEGGDVEAQIRALWCWLGEGDTMAPPPGLDSGPWAYEVLPNDGLRLISVFMKDVSPRVLCIGTPDGVHSAFDVENGRLAKAWRGRFLNAMGTWKGRAGALEAPASKDVIDLPPGRTVHAMPRLDAPWPEPIDGDVARADARHRVPAGPTRSLGRKVYPDGSVMLRYTSGALIIEERLRPAEIKVPDDTGAEVVRSGLERSFHVIAPAGGVGEPIIARVAVARQFDRVRLGDYRVRDGGWPRVLLDEVSGRVARVVQAKPLSETEGRNRTAQQPVIDGRYRRKSAKRAAQGDTSIPMEELRVPVALTPMKDGSGRLEGTFYWTMAW